MNMKNSFKAKKFRVLDVKRIYFALIALVIAAMATVIFSGCIWREGGRDDNRGHDRGMHDYDQRDHDEHYEHH